MLSREHLLQIREWANSNAATESVRLDVKALIRELDRLRQRCAVCMYYALGDRPVCGAFDQYLPCPPDGLCDCGKFKPREEVRDADEAPTPPVSCRPWRGK